MPIPEGTMVHLNDSGKMYAPVDGNGVSMADAIFVKVAPRLGVEWGQYVPFHHGYRFNGTRSFTYDDYEVEIINA